MRAAWLVVAIVLGVAAPLSAGESATPAAPADMLEETVDRTSSPEMHSRRRCGCGMGAVVLLLLLAPIALGVWAIALVIRASRRRGKLRTPGEPIAPLTAESMARAVISGHLFTIGVSLVVIALLQVSDDGALAVLLSWIPLVRTIRIARATRLLRWLERGLPAQLHDDLLAAGGSYIVVSRRIVRDAHMHAVPTSIVR